MNTCNYVSFFWVKNVAITAAGVGQSQHGINIGADHRFVVALQYLGNTVREEVQVVGDLNGRSKLKG